MLQDLHDFDSKKCQKMGEKKPSLYLQWFVLSAVISVGNHKKSWKKKKNHFYWQGVLLVCFWFIRFWFLYTAQTWKKVAMSKKQNKIK